MQHREEIVRLRETERLSERQIAHRLEIPASTVHYWLVKESAQGVQPPAPRGRPRVTTAEEDEALYKQSIQHPFSSAVDLKDELLPHISVDTVRKRLKERGMRCRVPARKPFLSPSHIHKRLEFARRYQYWGPEDWARILFSDEKIFRSSSTGRLRVYRPRDSDRFASEYIHVGPKKRNTICVWLAFGKEFKAIHRVEQASLDAPYYTRHILRTILKPYMNSHEEEDLIFQQDLSSIHTSRLAKHWFEMNNIEWMEDWPPKGPDMNPVENIWAELVRRVRNDPTNSQQLWENVHEAFHALDASYFENLIESMPRRMQKVIEAQGRWTKY